MKKCKLCGEETKVGFNIDFELVPICEACASSIFLQQASWYVRQTPNKTNKYSTGTDPYKTNSDFKK